MIKRFEGSLPPFPFLVLGNSGAIIRAERFTDDASLKKDGNGDKQCVGTVILAGNGAPAGSELTFYAGSLINNYGAITEGGNGIAGGHYPWVFAPPTDDEKWTWDARSSDGVRPEAVSRKQ